MEDYDISMKEKELIKDQMEQFIQKEREWQSCSHCASDTQKQELHDNIEMAREALREFD